MPFARDLGRSAQGAVSSVEVRVRLLPMEVRVGSCALGVVWLVVVAMRTTLGAM